MGGARHGSNHTQALRRRDFIAMVRATDMWKRHYTTGITARRSCVVVGHLPRAVMEIVINICACQDPRETLHLAISRKGYFKLVCASGQEPASKN